MNIKWDIIPGPEPTPEQQAMIDRLLAVQGAVECTMEQSDPLAEFKELTRDLHLLQLNGFGDSYPAEVLRAHGDIIWRALTPDQRVEAGVYSEWLHCNVVKDISTDATQVPASQICTDTTTGTPRPDTPRPS